MRRREGDVLLQVAFAAVPEHGNRGIELLHAAHPRRIAVVEPHPRLGVLRAHERHHGVHAVALGLDGETRLPLREDEVEGLVQTADAQFRTLFERELVAGAERRGHVERRELGVGVVLDDEVMFLAAVLPGRVVVRDHELLVGGQVHVRLDPVRPHVVGGGERLQRVLGMAHGVAAVRGDAVLGRRRRLEEDDADLPGGKRRQHDFPLARAGRLAHEFHRFGARHHELRVREDRVAHAQRERVRLADRAVEQRHARKAPRGVHAREDAHRTALLKAHGELALRHAVDFVQKRRALGRAQVAGRGPFHERGRHLHHMPLHALLVGIGHLRARLLGQIPERIPGLRHRHGDARERERHVHGVAQVEPGHLGRRRPHVARDAREARAAHDVREALPAGTRRRDRTRTAAVLVQRLGLLAHVPVERHRVRAARERERRFRDDRPRRLLQDAARIRLLLVAHVPHEPVVTAALRLARHAERLRHHVAGIRLRVVPRARTDPHGAAVRTRQRREQRTVVASGVDRVRPHRLIRHAAIGICIKGAVPRRRRVACQRLLVERQPRGAHRLAHGLAVQLGGQFRARPAAARLRVERGKAPIAEATLRLAHAHAQVIVKPETRGMECRDHRVDEGALVSEDVRRTRTQNAPDPLAVHTHLPGVVRELVVARHGTAVVGGAVSEGASLLVREQYAVRLAGGAVRGERGAIRRHALDRLDSAGGEPDFIAGAGKLAVYGHQALEVGQVTVNRPRIPHDHKRPCRLCRQSQDRCQDQNNSSFHCEVPPP